MSKDVPDHMKELVLPFDWDVRRVWALEASVEKVALQRVQFLLESPFWSHNPTRFTDFDLRPMDVLCGAIRSEYHLGRIDEADTSHPIDLIDHDARLWILDGVHRVAKLYRRGRRSVRMRRHSILIRSAIRPVA